MLPSFLIGKYEVTFRDYLKFWKSLPDPALRRRYQGWYAFEPGSGGTARIWNDDGELTASGEIPTGPGRRCCTTIRRFPDIRPGRRRGVSPGTVPDTAPLT